MLNQIKVQGGDWSSVSDYPYHDTIGSAPLLSVRDGFIVVGGHSLTDEYVGTIAKFTMSSQEWSRLGTLMMPRVGHGAIFIGSDKFMVVGGTPSSQESFYLFKNLNLVHDQLKIYH